MELDAHNLLRWLGSAVLIASVAVYAVLGFRALRGRRLLFGTALSGALPVAYVGLTWAGALKESWLRFERPWLAVPCAVLVVAVAHRLARGSQRTGPFRRTLTELMTGIALLAGTAAVLGVEIGRPLDRLAVLVVVDRSRSMDLVPNAEARMRGELELAQHGMREEDRLGVIAFAADAALEEPLRPASHLSSPQRAELARDATDLSAALRRALAEVPADSAARLVLMTDGVPTRGNVLEAAASAFAAGVPVDVIPLEQERLPDVRLVAVRVPPRADAGEALELRLVTESTVDTDVEVRVSLDGKPVVKASGKLRSGQDVLTLKERAPGPGLHRYDVELTALRPGADGTPEDNAASAFVRVRGQALALVLERDVAVAGALTRALESAGFVVEVRGPTGIPSDVAGFAAYDLIALSDIRAADFATAQLEALASYIRDVGGGLLLMGGDGSLGPGGFSKTPIEEISPVAFDLKQDRRRASLAEVIAIDISGSMAAQATARHTKLELANEAAIRSAELLGQGDRLGIAHVDTTVDWTIPLGPIPTDGSLAKRVRAKGPGGGGIYVDVSLRAAYEALAREQTNLKHVLLFADGSDAEERSQAPRLVADAARRGITTSVVALGRGSDVPDLEKLSRLGGGRFYLIEDAARLPAVFAQETVLAARSAINEVVFQPSVSGSGAPLRGVSFASAPPLRGYVVTLPKPRAQLLLTGPEGDPVLATWSVGVGRSAVFTSDYKDRWGRDWTQWEGAARLFGQLGRDVSRREDDASVRLEADAASGELQVRATAVDDDGRAESFRRLRLVVSGPDGFRAQTALEASGPGSYSASVPLSRPGAFVVTAVDELTGTPLATTGAVLNVGQELRPTGTDRGLLRRIATLTGGRERDTLAGVFATREKKRFAFYGLAAWLLPCAAAALLLAVAARRLALPDRWLASLRSGLGATSALLAPRQKAAAEPSPVTHLAASLRLARENKRSAPEARPAAVVTRPPVAQTPPSEHGTAGLPPSQLLIPTPRPASSAQSAKQDDPQRAAANARQPSAAEVLLARRKGKKAH
jgi:Mg-chelatase subunit ChlD